MKFITSYEYNVEDTDKIIEKWSQRLEEIKKEPEKYPKILFGPYEMGEPAALGVGKGFTVHEVDDPKQLMTL